MSSYCCAAVDSNAVYVRIYTHVLACSISTFMWTQLPDCSFASCPSVIVNNLLTLIGGTVTSGHATNKVLSLISEGNARKWVEVFPPMPTKRYRSSALCTETALVVAGGVGGGRTLQTVEVMNTKTHQWSTAADLPIPTFFGSLVQVDNRVYMLGGCDNPGRGALGTKAGYTCALNALLPASLQSLRERFAGIFTNRANVWSRIADLPVTQSVCVSFHGQLLSVGGKVDLKSTAAIHMYDPSTNSWKIISHMATARFDCFVAVLPNDQLMVVGGRMGETDTVEIAELSI